MSSNSLNAFLNSRAKYIHISAPLVQIEVPKQAKRLNGFRPSKTPKAGKGTEIITIVDPRKSSRVTRSGQKAAKQWVREKTRELKAFLVEAEKNPNMDRASFFYVEEEGTWKIGIFHAQAEEPHYIVEDADLQAAVEKVKKQSPEFISFFRKEDLERAPVEHYPALRFVVNG